MLLKQKKTFGKNINNWIKVMRFLSSKLKRRKKMFDEKAFFIYIVSLYLVKINAIKRTVFVD